MRVVPPSIFLCLWLSPLTFALGDDDDSDRKAVADPSHLSLERIFTLDDFAYERFGPARWVEDGSGYTTLETSDGPAGGRDIVRYDAATGARSVLVAAERLIPPGESGPLSISDYRWSKDGSKLLVFTNTRRVWRAHTRGDYWVLDLTSRELRKLGGEVPASTLMFATLAPDGLRVAYVRDNDLYVEELRGGGIVRLTDDGSDRIINGTFDWVYEEELSLRKGFLWSPDSRRIAYWQLDSEGVRQFLLLDNIDSLYPTVQRIPYPKVGETNSACRVGVIPASGGHTRWIDIPGDPREHYIARMEWAASSEELVIQQLNRLQNTNRIFLGAAETGAARQILVEKDEAWVDIHDDLRWLDGGERFLWLSESDGWRHAYLVSRSGEEVTRITPGEFDVIRVAAVDEKGRWLYFMASPDNPTQRYLYRIRFDGTDLERLTPEGEAGTHSYDIAPGTAWAFQTHSRFGHPPVTRLVGLPGHETVRVLVENQTLRERVDELARSEVEFFRVDIGGEDHVELDAWCMKPPDFDERLKYPVLIYVYGEPAGQTVLDRWSGRSYLWHLMLTQQGYLVFSIDNRGTPAPRGRAWRKSVYRQIGILASKDQAAALRAILELRPSVDPERVGVWGWSGGGSMSLNLIFRHPELYHTAMSVAPVSNQRYYDTIYQERYMGLPQDNVEGFRDGSPITHAHKLKGNLLVVHGTADDNVHYQSTEALVDELIRHGKHFTMMAYPNRRHGISEGLNTRRHLYGLLTRYLDDNLPVGPRER